MYGCSTVSCVAAVAAFVFAAQSRKQASHARAQQQAHFCHALLLGLCQSVCPSVCLSVCSLSPLYSSPCVRLCVSHRPLRGTAVKASSAERRGPPCRGTVAISGSSGGHTSVALLPLHLFRQLVAQVICIRNRQRENIHVKLRIPRNQEHRARTFADGTILPTGIPYVQKLPVSQSQTLVRKRRRSHKPKSWSPEPTRRHACFLIGCCSRFLDI